MSAGPYQTLERSRIHGMVGMLVWMIVAKVRRDGLALDNLLGYA